MNIRIDNLCLWHSEQLILKQLHWSLAPQQWTCLLGQSGIGKSSLLRLLAGLLPEHSRSEGSLQVAREQLAYLGQNDALLPWLSVLDNAALSARLGSYSKNERKLITLRAADLLKKVGLADALQLYPRQLSGGMRQRVALVRALVENKPVILMDEPFSRLDAVTRLQLQNLAAELLRGRTVLLVTHDPTEALRLADRIDLIAGRPATIKTLLHFANPGPRALTAELMKLQSDLFQALSEHHDQTHLKAVI